MKPRRWTAWIDYSQFGMRTPWFRFVLSVGGMDYDTGDHWWGWKVSWAPYENPAPGQMAFSKSKLFETRKRWPRRLGIPYGA